jgi:hypothetical protein
LSGWGAKKLGKELPKQFELPDEEFQEKIRKAICLKAAARPDMLADLKASDLPLKHYYVYGGKPKDAGYSWILDIWEEVRKS